MLWYFGAVKFQGYSLAIYNIACDYNYLVTLTESLGEGLDLGSLLR